MCNAQYAGPPHGAVVTRAGDVMTPRASQQLVPDRCTATAAEGGSRGGKMKSEKSSADHYAQRVGPYPTPQQYMLNKRAKYAGTAASIPAEVGRYRHLVQSLLSCTVLETAGFLLEFCSLS